MLEAGLCTELQSSVPCSTLALIQPGFHTVQLKLWPCTWKCVPLVDLLNGLLWVKLMASQYFALGMQLPPAPQSPFSLYGVVNQLHSPDRTAFAFWAHMLLYLGNTEQQDLSLQGLVLLHLGSTEQQEPARAHAAHVIQQCLTYPVVSYTQH